ncbi:MAG: hypothetical protein U0931_40760 [Vulcanimicrobiota bacterium]
MEFSFNPQDRLVMEPGSLLVPGVRPDGSTAKFTLDEPLTAKDGKFVYSPAEPSYHAANAFAAANRMANMFEQAWGQPIAWARAERLTVHGDEGQDLNAYYDGEGLHFFHYPVGDQMVYSGDSGEVVGHECGHALLDAVRPGYFSTWSTDPGAFHESFGDVVALLGSLRDERTLTKVLEQTGGDLSKANSAAELGEELGTAINTVVGHDVTGGNFTRNAINQFTWQDPNTLPESGPPDQLHNEVHDFSRLWTGAFYDIFTGIVNQNMARGQDARSAILSATDAGFKMYADLMRPGYAPEGEFTYRDMAAALIKSENEQNGGQYSGLIGQVMSARKILPEGAGLLAPQVLEAGTRSLATTLKGERFGQFEGARVETLLSGGQTSLMDAAAQEDQLSSQMARLIQAGEIKMTEPNQVVTTRDLFKKNGEPYRGVVRWVDGQMSIERVKIAG